MDQEKAKPTETKARLFSTRFLITATVLGALVFCPVLLLIGIAVLSEGKKLTGNPPGDPDIGACLLGLVAIFNLCIWMLWIPRRPRRKE